MAKAKEETALVKWPTLQQFKLATMSPGIAQIIQENMSGRQVTAFDLDRIKFPSGGGLGWEVPTLSGVPDLAKEITGIIIAKRRGRVYYDTPYDGSNNPPVCSSNDGITGVGEPGGDCAKCPFSQFGSDEGGGQACSERELLFIIRRDDVLPIVMSVPPTSLGVLSKYFLRLASAGRPYWSLVTTLGLTKAKNAGGIEYSKLAITPGAMLTSEEQEKISGMAKDMQAIFSATPIQPQAE